MGSKRNKKVKSESFEELNDTLTTNNNNVPGDLKSPKNCKKRVTKLPSARHLETSTEIAPRKTKKAKQQKTKNKIIDNHAVITETINENVSPENRVIPEPTKKNSKNKKIQENIVSSPERNHLDNVNLVEKKFDIKSVEIISPPNTELSSPEKTSKRKPKRNKVQSKRAENIVDVPIETTNKSVENHVVEEGPVIIKNTVEENTDVLCQNQHVEKKSLQWSDEDFSQLISRMEKLIPEKDVLAYSTRIDKLDWNEVAFDKYSSEDCKKAWSELQKHIRRFRLLREVLHDAKEWLKTPQAKKTKMRHPDMPRKPMSSYMIFYLKKKSKIQMEHPGSDAHDITKIASVMFKALTPEKKEKYEKLAAMEREEYKIKMEQFYEDHPELKPQPVEKIRPVKTKPEKPPKLPKPPKPPKMPKPVKPMKPEKPKTPFLYFYKEEFNKLEDKEIDKGAFKEICKEKWKNMSDKKKLSWIIWAEKRQAEYTEQIKAYMQKNPEFVPYKKNVISKEQMLLKERLAGKPVKPPNSAYSLFSRKYLLSDQIKHIDPRERMNYVSTEWKKLSEEERKKYQDEVVKLLAEYESAFNSYLQSLPEDKRKEELEKAHPKRKMKPTEKNEPPKKKLKKPAAKPKKKFKEPEQPPISAFKYFIKVYKGEDSPVTAWKALTAAEKKKFEDELTEKKRQYIVDFEKFLKSLSKEELEEYSKARKQIVKNDDDDDDEDDESSNCSSGSEVSDEEDCDISS